MGVHEAKTQLSALIREVQDGEEVLVTRGGRPVAKLVAVHSAQDGDPPKVRGGGMFAGQMHMAEDFEDDEELLAELFGIPEADPPR